MGGGGSYQSAPISQDLEGALRKEAEAKQELARAKAARRNIFISFSSKDMDQVRAFRAQAKNPKNPIDLVDRSVKVAYDSTRAEYIRQRISERIRQCSKTVVFVSDNAVKSAWVNWEVNRSLELGKEVVAFYSGDKRPKKLPKSITDNTIKVVSWSDLPKEIKPKE